jgi:hypothetical protein
MNASHKVHFVCKLSGCEGGVSTMVGEICPSSFHGIEEVAMFGGVVETGGDGGG